MIVGAVSNPYLNPLSSDSAHYQQLMQQLAMAGRAPPQRFAGQFAAAQEVAFAGQQGGEADNLVLLLLD